MSTNHVVTVERRKPIDNMIANTLKPSNYVRKGWCQGALARDAQGNYCLETGPDVVAWCVYGALYAAYPWNILKRERILDKLALLLDMPLGTWNDDPERTQAEVITLLESIGE